MLNTYSFFNVTSNYIHRNVCLSIRERSGRGNLEDRN